MSDLTLRYLWEIYKSQKPGPGLQRTLVMLSLKWPKKAQDSSSKVITLTNRNQVFVIVPQRFCPWMNY